MVTIVKTMLVDEVAETNARTAESRWRARSMRRVLVVDDNRDSREALKVMLQCCGFRNVIEAIDADSALEAVRRDRPSLAFIEVALTQMNGYELARRLDGLRATDFLRLVALLGSGRPQSLKVAYDCGFDRALVKPLVLEKLMETLETTTGKTSLRRPRLNYY